MSPPISMCITKEEREKAGYRSFRQWIEDLKNVHCVHRTKCANVCKAFTPSNWVNPFKMYYRGKDEGMNHS